MCTANALFCCLSAATIKNACFTLLGGNQFICCIILSCDTLALYHCVHGKSLFVVVFVGPCPFRLLCFSAGWTQIWLGDLRVAFCLVVFVLGFWFAMLHDHLCPWQFISNLFFTCKNRALERDRPYQRKKVCVCASVCVKTFVCKSVWCVKVFVCKGVCVKALCVNASVCKSVRV